MLKNEVELSEIENISEIKARKRLGRSACGAFLSGYVIPGFPWLLDERGGPNEKFVSMN